MEWHSIFFKRGLPLFLGISFVIYLLGAGYFLPGFWFCSPLIALWWITSIKKHLQKSFLNSNVELRAARARRLFELDEMIGQQTDLRKERLTISQKREAGIKQVGIWQKEMKSIKENPPNPENSPHFQVYQENLVRLDGCERQAKAQQREFMRNLRVLFPEKKSSKRK
jgi:hypothetical protein